MELSEWLCEVTYILDSWYMAIEITLGHCVTVWTSQKLVNNTHFHVIIFVSLEINLQTIFLIPIRSEYMKFILMVILSMGWAVLVLTKMTHLVTSIHW